jgi:hypothetical protein
MSNPNDNIVAGKFKPDIEKLAKELIANSLDRVATRATRARIVASYGDEILDKAVRLATDFILYEGQLGLMRIDNIVGREQYTPPSWNQ